MKKEVAGLLAGCLLAGSAMAQDFYVRLGLGYGIPQAGQTMYTTGTPFYNMTSGYNGTRTYNSNESETFNIKGASFSSGVQSMIGLGYMFNRNIGLQLDAMIALSNTKYSFNDENAQVPVSSSSSGANPVSTPYDVTTQIQAKNTFFLIPSLVIQSGGDKLNAYARFGLALPLNTKISEDQIYVNPTGTGYAEPSDFIWNIKNSFSIGFAAAVGIKYSLNERINIWGELSLLSLSEYIKEQDFVNVSPTNAPLQYAGAQTIKFSKTGTLDSTGTQFPTYAQPFSNIGINVGVSFILGHHDRDLKGGDEYIDRSKPFRRNN